MGVGSLLLNCVPGLQFSWVQGLLTWVGAEGGGGPIATETVETSVCLYYETIILRTYLYRN